MKDSDQAELDVMKEKLPSGWEYRGKVYLEIPGGKFYKRKPPEFYPRQEVFIEKNFILEKGFIIPAGWVVHRAIVEIGGFSLHKDIKVKELKTAKKVALILMKNWRRWRLLELNTTMELRRLLK